MTLTTAQTNSLNALLNVDERRYSAEMLLELAGHARSKCRDATEDVYDGYSVERADNLRTIREALLLADEELETFDDAVRCLNDDAYGILINLLAHGADELQTNTADFTMYTYGLTDVLTLADSLPILWGLAGEAEDVRNLMA